MHTDNLKITCVGCGKIKTLPIGAATTAICYGCGSSKHTLSGDELKDYYSLECLTCHKIFKVGAGIAFDIREFIHCRRYIFKFTKTSASPFLKKSQVKSNDNIYSLSLDSISEIIEKEDQADKTKIALITVTDPGYCTYKYYPYISKKLRDEYIVYTIASNKINKDNLALINSCDLAIGGVNDWTRSAIQMKVPTIVMHTPILIEGRGSVALLGNNKIEPDKIVEMAERILSVPDLTYCIVTYNRRDKLEKCINAILKYKRANEDLIIIDNHSSDDTRIYLVQLKKEKNIIVRRLKSNTGCVKGRNVAMKLAKGRNLFVLDDDQIIFSNTLYNMRGIDADIIGTEAWRMLGNCLPTRIGANDESVDYVGAGGMLLPRRIMQELNYFDEVYAPGYYEDSDFCFRAKKAGYKIAGCNNNIIHSGPGMDQVLGENSAAIKNHNKEIFFKRWKDKTRWINKPRILIVVDVPGWAWDIKTKNIIRYLESEFDFTIKYNSQINNCAQDEYDLCFAYDFPFVRKFKGVSRGKIIAGVTAHTYTNFDDYVTRLQLCGAVHANSILLFDELKKINSNAFYVPNGVDENHFVFQPRAKEEFCAGYVGKPHERKGFNNFIVPACKKAGVKLKAQTTKYNNPNVINYYEMPSFYQDIDCVVIASDMDGTPNQLLEAAAVGRTFVGVPIGNVPEFHNEENGFIVKRNVDEIAEKLAWLKNHRKECIEMGIKARKTIEKDWTWEKQSENYRQLFRSMLE